MRVRLCYLVDNLTAYATQLLNEQELEQKNQEAQAATDGNLSWVHASEKIAEMPRSEVFKHISS